MSHEIRTPMDGVLGLTELVLATEREPRQRQFVELAHASARSLLAINNDILDLSKIEAGRLTLDPAPFELRALLHDALASHRIESEAKSQIFECVVDDAMPATLVGDALRLRQIVTHLVGNAVKFTSHGGIEVSVRAGDQHSHQLELHIAVRDTGIGISDQDLEHGFEPFAQADASITRRYGGTGLGLSIVQRLARIMGGEVRATSTVGQGSSFEVTLRLALPGS